MSTITHKSWTEYFSYNPESGNLVWKHRPEHLFKSKRAFAAWNANYEGKVAGHNQPAGAGSARYVRVWNKMHRAHRIIWEMHNGPIPKGLVIDHINGNFYDNRISNLRLATQSQNGMNRLLSKANKLRIKGVSWDRDRKKFKAVISVSGKIIQLGRFDIKALAASAYAKGSLMHHGTFSPFYRKSA